MTSAPAAGPSAQETVWAMPVQPTAWPRRAGGTASDTSAMTAAERNAKATPASTRNSPMSTTDVASAQPKALTQKSAAAMSRNDRLARRSASQPVSGRATSAMDAESPARRPPTAREAPRATA